MPRSRNFNDVIQADVFYLKVSDRKLPVLSLVDAATRFMAAYLLDDETSDPMSWHLRKCGSDTSGHPRSW